MRHLGGFTLALLVYAYATIVSANQVLPVKRSVHLRADPARSSASLAVLVPPMTVELLNPQPQNGFIKVRAADGKTGWAWAQNFRTSSATSTPPVSTFAARKSKASSFSKGSACADDLESCPASGCAQEGTPDGLVNEAKRALPDNGEPVHLSFTEFALLQAAVDDLGFQQGKGSKLTASMRRQLRDLEIAGGKKAGEGTFVQLVGYLAPERNINPAGPESVNCKLGGAENNDVHLPVVQYPGGTEYHAVVVEPIPQVRPAGWTIGKYRELQEIGALLRIRGKLFYDNKHKVRDDPENEEGLKSEPKRFTLWEVHPVTELYYCNVADQKCEPANDVHWTRIE